MSQLAGSALWTEHADGASTPDVEGVFLVKSGTSWVLSDEGPADGAFINWDGSGVYTLVDFTQRLYAFDNGTTYDLAPVMYFAYRPGETGYTFSRSTTATSVLDTAGTDPAPEWDAATLLDALGGADAVLVDDGAGGIEFSDDPTDDEIAFFAQATDGTMVLVRSDQTDDQLQLIAIGSAVSTYE